MADAKAIEKAEKKYAEDVALYVEEATRKAKLNLEKLHKYDNAQLKEKDRKFINSSINHNETILNLCDIINVYANLKGASK